MRYRFTYRHSESSDAIISVCEYTDMAYAFIDYARKHGYVIDSVEEKNMFTPRDRWHLSKIYHEY